MYKASLILVSKDLIKDVNKLLYGFVWKGSEKIKRTALINDIENGARCAIYDVFTESQGFETFY